MHFRGFFCLFLKFFHVALLKKFLLSAFKIVILRLISLQVFSNAHSPLLPTLERILKLLYLGMQTITNGLTIPLFEEHCNDLFILLYIICMCVENTSFSFKKTLL